MILSFIHVENINNFIKGAKDTKNNAKVHLNLFSSDE
jgi:CRISPR/Cas system CMR-associated protein Cmr3 (group 5 of RAMP superfamily)